MLRTPHIPEGGLSEFSTRAFVVPKPCMRPLYCAVTVLLIAAHVAAAPLDHGDLVTFASRNDAAFISEESNEGGGNKEADCGGLTCSPRLVGPASLS